MFTIAPERNILSQMNPVHIIRCCCFYGPLNIFFSSNHRRLQYPLPFRYFDQNSVLKISHPFHEIHLYYTIPHKKDITANIYFSPLVTAQHTTCSNTRLGLLKMGIIMPETCWESDDNKHLTVASCWFSLSLHLSSSCDLVYWINGNKVTVCLYLQVGTTQRRCLVSWNTGVRFVRIVLRRRCVDSFTPRLLCTREQSVWYPGWL